MGFAQVVITSKRESTMDYTLRGSCSVYKNYTSWLKLSVFVSEVLGKANNMFCKIKFISEELIFSTSKHDKQVLVQSMHALCFQF